MSEQKACIRCERAIDRYARMCVYCNWDQSQPYAPQAPIPGAPVYVPPKDNRARNRVLGIAGGVALIVAAFVIGTVMHGFEPKAVAPATETAQTASVSPTAAHRSDVTLVPATDAMPAPVLEAPVTSAPPQAPGQEASDATALPSDQYAAVAAKAKAQKQQARENQTVDPREVRGRAYEEAPQAAPAQTQTRKQTPAPAPAAPETTGNVPMTSSASRTEAFPEYKPLPAIHVDRETTARVTLTVGADGRVKDIDIIDPIPGATSKLIESVQTWRFRPATENGTPVPARVTVTITLHGDE